MPCHKHKCCKDTSLFAENNAHATCDSQFYVLFRVIASGDRDGKLRVSSLPQDPMKGSWEIMAFCLLHTAAITCSAFCRPAGGQAQVLVSGGLDGNIVAWDYTNGDELATMQPNQKPSGETSKEAGICTHVHLHEHLDLHRRLAMFCLAMNPMQ